MESKGHHPGNLSVPGSNPAPMPALDETDLEILELLVADARRPYSEIADAVDLSAPAVSDRVARLGEAGIIRRFTVDLDHGQLHEGVPVLLDLAVGTDATGTGELRETLLSADAVDHVFTTAAGDLVVFARLPDTDVRSWVDATVGDGAVGDVSVTLLTRADWSPSLGATEFALHCAECGNTVDSEGTAARLGGDLYQFCCPSCESRFRETYERLDEGAD